MTSDFSRHSRDPREKTTRPKPFTCKIRPDSDLKNSNFSFILEDGKRLKLVLSTSLFIYKYSLLMRNRLQVF